ncbi:hypothetical protein [Roseovarius sp.]|uniref:hypothetical protein n=1 Tax=Roseovarius sp. TaxID=1486281 RepID=UPI003A974E37
MFGFLKKKQPMPPQEDFRALMQHMHASLIRADRLTGIERHFAVASLFGANIPAIRSGFPNVPIEDDCPAMIVLSSGLENPDWEAIFSDVEYSIQQARDCPADIDAIVAIVMSLLAPRHFDAKFAEVCQQAD